MDLDFLIANRKGYADLFEDVADLLAKGWSDRQYDAGLLRGLADRLREQTERQPDILHRHLAEGLNYASGFLDDMARRLDSNEPISLDEAARDCAEAAKLIRDTLMKFGLWSSVTITGQGGGGGGSKTPAS